MNKKDIISRSFVNALGVVLYVTVFAWCVNNFHQMNGPQSNGFIGMVLFLILFIISASVTGSLVLMKPAMLYHDGKKKEAIDMFAYTLGFLIIMAMIIILILNSSY